MAMAHRVLALLLCLVPLLRAQVLEERVFLPQKDIATQREALGKLLDTVADWSILLQPPGEPTNRPWTQTNVSYCDWWGVTCCGSLLPAYQAICNEGAQSVATLQLQNVAFNATLPDVFDQLPDLQLLDISANRGAYAPQRMDCQRRGRRMWGLRRGAHMAPLHGLAYGPAMQGCCRSALDMPPAAII